MSDLLERIRRGERFDKLVHTEREVLWFDGEGNGPSVVNMVVMASWINGPTVAFAPNAEVPSKLLPRHDPQCYGGPMMTAEAARRFAKALIDAADFAEQAEKAQPYLPVVNQ